jgi:hypothetical protein
MATMSQQVGITMGIPTMSAIATAHLHSAAATPGAVLSGLTTAIAVNAALCVLTALGVGLGLRHRAASATR